MANRHKAQCRASGGRVAYAAGSSNVVKEAAERKFGGKVVGGSPGSKGKSRVDKRARGGGVGADKNPFSSAGSGMRTSK